LSALPNVPAPDVPPGADENDNVEVRRWGEPFAIAAAKDHATLGEASKLMDFEAAARMSGSRFVVLKGEVARLERALGQFMLDLHTREHGYLEVQPPLLVRDEAMYGTSQLPKFAEDLFKAVRQVTDPERKRQANAAVARYAESFFHDFLSRKIPGYDPQKGGAFVFGAAEKPGIPD